MLVSCGIVIAVVVYCRLKIKRTRQDPHAQTGHAIHRQATVMAEEIEVLAGEDSNAIPTAAETGLPIANATLTIPPALMADMDALPVAVVHPLSTGRSPSYRISRN